MSEFANLGSNFKRDFVKGLLEIFGEELVAAQVAVLYHNLLLQASRGKILALEWTLPRLIRKVRIASNKLKR